MNIKTVTRAMRGPFLILTPVCVFLGASTVVASQTDIDIPQLMLALLGALMAHISVNTLNEYYDFKSGLDLETIKTPFSGGSGALVQNPEMADTVFAVGIISLLITLITGFYFTWLHGPGIVPLGVAGLLLILSYTGWANKHPLVCLIAPGTGFGFLMVMGSQFVLQGEYSLLALLAAFVPFFLVNNLLLLNQYPDIRADKNAGRYHMPIAYGTTMSNMVYALFALATVLLITVCIWLNYFPLMSLIALLPMPLAFFALSGAIKHGEGIGHFPHYLAANVAVSLLTPLLLALSIVLG